MTKYVNKVTTTVDGVQTVLIDVSQTTATDEVVFSGRTYIRADGSEGVGTFEETVVNLQESKDVTVTENGTQSVTPDEGYDGIKQVNVIVETPSKVAVATTDAEMTTFLENSEVGTYVQFTGTSDTYDTNRMYIIKEGGVS